MEEEGGRGKRVSDGVERGRRRKGGRVEEEEKEGERKEKMIVTGGGGRRGIEATVREDGE